MWIFLALFSRLLWAGSNVADQMVTRAHPRHKALSALGLQQCLEIPVGAAIILWAGLPPPAALLWAALGVVAQCAALLPYYKCLETEDAHDIVPYLELTPVIVAFMALIFRGEMMTSAQGIGVLLVVAGGFLFSWDFSRGHFRRGTFLLMALSSFFFATTQIALHTAEGAGAGVWGAVGAFLLGQGATGLMLLSARTDVRATVIETLKVTRGRSAAMGLFSNLLGVGGITCLLAAYTMAPVIGPVAGLSGVQPFFSFFLAVVLGLVLPARFARVRFDRETKAKLLLLFAILAGVWLLAQG